MKRVRTLPAKATPRAPLRAKAKQKKYLVWACSFKPLMYPMEKMDVAIHSAEARVAKKIPKASTLNCNVIPGEKSIIVDSMTFPAKTVGIMEATKENLVTEASTVQSSLRFLRLSPVARMRIAAIAETKRVRIGRMEDTTSTHQSPMTQRPGGTAN